MKNFIRELRRREVFRTAGLYVGICWILIEVGSVVLPTFDAPEWILRGTIVAAVAGFPVMLLLAWFFDVNSQGITRQDDSAAKNLGPRKSDLAIIGVLVLALVVSVSLNLKNKSSGTVAVEPTPVLIAEFDNSAGEPLFDDVLEEALTVGVEVAPHITVFDKNQPRELALQFAQQQGIPILLAGSVQQSGGQIRIGVEAIDVSSGNIEFAIEEKAESQEAVLRAVGALSASVRKRLGDDQGFVEGGPPQSFEASSLAAANAYAKGRQFEKAANLEEAAKHFELATVADPNLGRAHSRLALIEYSLARDESAAQRWAKALSLAGTMTEREQLRALGRYALIASGDSDAATKIFAELVGKYPADVAARGAYAAASLQQLDFVTAVEQTRKILQLYPQSDVYRTKLALYAMYQGDWEAVTDDVAQVNASNPEHGPAYLPLAITALAHNQIDAARDAYGRMAQTDPEGHGASLAELGLADIELYLGQIDAAQKRLQSGIEADRDRGDDEMMARKTIALAESYVEGGNLAAAAKTAARALSLSDSTAVSVSAAMLYVQAADIASARIIAETLAEKADANSQAYGKMLDGMILESEGQQTNSILAMREALTTADLWLIRYLIGIAYFQAGNFTEALGELTTLKVRQGEAAAIFLDDMPTYRALAELPYWIGRVQENLGMLMAARASFEEYVSIRGQRGALAEDASERIAEPE